MSASSQSVFIVTVAQVLGVQTNQIVITAITAVSGGVEVVYVISYLSLLSAPTVTAIVTTLTTGNAFTQQLIINAASSSPSTSQAFSAVVPASPAVQLLTKSPTSKPSSPPVVSDSSAGQQSDRTLAIIAAIVAISVVVAAIGALFRRKVTPTAVEPDAVRRLSSEDIVGWPQELVDVALRLRPGYRHDPKDEVNFQQV
jgi:hypothetical protein